jgi:hypothetical protein
MTTIREANNFFGEHTCGGVGNAPFILKSLNSDLPLPPNTADVARLKDRIAMAQQAFSARPIQKMPALAQSISGHTFSLSTNISIGSFPDTSGIPTFFVPEFLNYV